MQKKSLIKERQVQVHSRYYWLKISLIQELSLILKMMKGSKEDVFFCSSGCHSAASIKRNYIVSYLQYPLFQNLLLDMSSVTHDKVI